MMALQPSLRPHLVQPQLFWGGHWILIQGSTACKLNNEELIGIPTFCEMSKKTKLSMHNTVSNNLSKAEEME